MPTAGGLPKPGEHWRLTRRLPKPGGQWKTSVIEIIVVERGTGSCWSLRVRDMNTGEISLWVDASYDFSHGNLKYVRPDGDDEFRKWYRDEFGCFPDEDDKTCESYRSAWEHGRSFERSVK